MGSLRPVNDLAIDAQGLRKSFGDVHALAGVDLAVPTGTVLGLLGPNGAGKTTTVRVLTTLLKPDAGTATVGVTSRSQSCMNWRMCEPSAPRCNCNCWICRAV